MTCEPSQLLNLIEKAKLMCEKLSSRNRAYVDANINYRINAKYSGIWGNIPELYILKDCVAPNEVRLITNNAPDESNQTLTYILIAAAVTKILKIW